MATQPKVANVTKAELAERLVQMGVSERHARKIVDYFFHQIIQALKRGEVIHMVGFGAFRFKTRRARQGRNPRTGERVAVPSKRIIQFRPGNELKELVRERSLIKKG